jgi:hypothetical protein
LLKELDIKSTDFLDAVKHSYESGNRFWLWQRMVRTGVLNGGVLNIDSTQMIPLHDHPGATGMLRIMEGEAEVWQFDPAVKVSSSSRELKLVSRKILRPGDVAVLTPYKGNIHAVRSLSKECSMLDFFIPPYDRKKRSWYEPVTSDWQGKSEIVCKQVSESDYQKS